MRRNCFSLLKKRSIRLRCRRASCETGKRLCGWLRWGCWVWRPALDQRADPVGVVAFVGEHDGSAFESVPADRPRWSRRGLTRRDQEAERAAHCVDERVDFRRESASATTHATISTPFCAGGMLVNAQRSSCRSSARLPSCAFVIASIRRSHTPGLAPAVEAVVDGRVRPVALRQVAPRRARAQHPEDAVQHPPVVYLRLQPRATSCGSSGSITTTRRPSDRSA